MVTATTTAPALKVGALVKVGPAYEMATCARTNHDEWTGAEGPIVRFDGADAVIDMGHDWLWINVERLTLASVRGGL